MDCKKPKSLKSPVGLGSYKSPMQERIKDSSKSTNKEEIQVLTNKSQHLDTEIQALETEGLKIEELDAHIDKLHEYNEIKDIGQMILGRIATLEGVRSQDLYECYGLNLDD